MLWFLSSSGDSALSNLILWLVSSQAKRSQWILRYFFYPGNESISPPKTFLKMIFLFPRWDMLVPWRVNIFQDLLSKVDLILIFLMILHLYILVSVVTWGNLLPDLIIQLIKEKFRPTFRSEGISLPFLRWFHSSHSKRGRTMIPKS